MQQKISVLQYCDWLNEWLNEWEEDRIVESDTVLGKCLELVHHENVI